jgi:predicted nucleotide-binding protein (sugar kinase/HSP70/actin superfamily)
MYESEYRLALDNAGFTGFRVLTFLSNKVIREGSQQPGLQYGVNFGLGMLNALNIGDVLFEMAYQIRPYEVNPGETDRVMSECVDYLARFLAARCQFEPFRQRAKPGRLYRTLSILEKVRYHLYGRDFRKALAWVRGRLDSIEVERTRARPIVKITGEFFSAIAEGDANHNMFAFLEKEGAEVSVEPIAGIVLYWLHQARMNHRRRRGIDSLGPSFHKKDWLLAFCDWFYRKQYHRAGRMLGGVRHLTRQPLLADLAAPYYHPLTRGGEGYLEVAKSLYHTRQRRSHMVLSLKPFGCMPSTQSDAVMAMVATRYPDMLFLPIETSADGEINALSRVQMMLGDARRKALLEFQAALASTGRTLDEIRAYVAEHRELRRPFYYYPRQPGVTGTAAQFVLHVARRMGSRKMA